MNPNRLYRAVALAVSLAALAAIFTVVSIIAPAPALAESASKTIALPAPDKTGGVPLMQALAQRHSTKSGFNGAPLPAQQLSDLLWAAWGVNREDGRRTAPSAMNKQEVQVFAALENGVWRYEPGHSLTMVLEGDWRAKLGGGSLVLLYAAPTASRWSGMHVGSIYQNVGLFCASAGLGDFVHASNASALDGKLPLPEGWGVLIVQSVGSLK